jgi:SHS2 domain-containing protein
VVGAYRFIEDVAIADCALELDGADLDDLFATAAEALAAVMVDPASVEQTIERTVDLEAEAIDVLLFDWLAELILRKDRDGEIFTGVALHVSNAAPWTLRARLRGAPIDGERMGLRNDPKAVTFHEFRVERRGAGWRARVVIDI